MLRIAVQPFNQSNNSKDSLLMRICSVLLYQQVLVFEKQFQTYMGHKNSTLQTDRLYFKQTTNPQIHIDKQQKNILKTLLQNDKWVLDNGKCKNLRIQSILTQIKQVNITVLNLNANNIETLPNMLHQIYFPYLQSLKLSGNNIVSIQDLVSIKAEKLVELSLSWNNITQTRPLRKCYFPKLRYLNLQHNYLPNLGRDLSRCNFPELREICVQDEKKTVSTCDSIVSDCMKWQSCKLYQIVCISSSKISCESRVGQMRQKYLNIKWYRHEKKEEKEKQKQNNDFI